MLNFCLFRIDICQKNQGIANKKRSGKYKYRQNKYKKRHKQNEYKENLSISRINIEKNISGIDIKKTDRKLLKK